MEGLDRIVPLRWSSFSISNPPSLRRKPRPCFKIWSRQRGHFQKHRFSGRAAECFPIHAPDTPRPAISLICLSYAIKHENRSSHVSLCSEVEKRHRWNRLCHREENNVCYVCNDPRSRLSSYTYWTKPTVPLCVAYKSSLTLARARMNPAAPFDVQEDHNIMTPYCFLLFILHAPLINGWPQANSRNWLHCMDKHSN